jgi:SPP1 gp7 family putative phage head morphogenesis protein
MCEARQLRPSINAKLRQDPTFTKTLRQKFEAEVNRRYKKVLAELNDFMAQAPEVVINKRYEFPVGPLETATILDFLNESVRRNIIDPAEAERIVREKGVTPDPNNWVESYLYGAYKKGVRRAQNEINKRSPKGNNVDLMKGALKRQNHQGKLEQILGRVYTDLEKIDEAMQAGIRREIALGLEAGEGTAKIAKRIEGRVEKIGRTRSRVLARTEVIRTHHQANIASYREAGVKQIVVQAEFSTAGDGRVCSECKGLEGKKFDLKTIEDMIPVHPNCRCVALPVVDL